MRKNITISENN